MASILRQRFPSFSALVPVYAVTAFPIFSWTIVTWFWKLPYWLNFLTAGEIGAVFSYAMATAFFETLLVICFLLLLCLILPSRLFRDQFLVRGTWLALGLTATFLGHGVWRGLLGFSYLEVPSFLWTVASVFVIVLITFAATRIRFMARAAEWLSDRLIVFLYLLIPIAVLSIVVVFIRNIF